KPEERRELFDEAAGIVKYKKRKASAEKSLEVEKQNLLRVNDIVTELEKRVEPLEKQSEKAKKYLQLKDELKQYDVQLFIQDYENFNEDLKEANENIANLDKELHAHKAEQEKIKEEFSSVESQIEQFDQEIESKRDKANKDRLLKTRIEGDINTERQKIVSIKEGKKIYADRLKDINEAVKQATNEREQYLQEKQAFANNVARMRQDETELQKEVEELEKSLQDIENELKTQTINVNDYKDQKAEYDIEKQRLSSLLEQNKISKAEINQRILANKSDVSIAEANMKQEEEALDKIKSEHDEEFLKCKKLENKIAELNEKKKANREKIIEAQRDYHLKSSKLETLKDISERYEGYGHSIRKIMEKKEENKGIIGVVADIIHVDKKYETAVETALGGNIQNVVTEDEYVAKDMINFLKKKKFGRVTFLPLTTVTSNPKSIKEEVFDEKGVIGRLSDLVEKDDRYDEVVKFLIGRYILVDHIDNAMKIAKKYNFRLRIVTLEGELINPGGSMAGGAFKNNNNLLSRKREMELLEEGITKASADLDKYRSRNAGIDEEVEKLNSQIAKKNETLKDLDIKKNTARIKYEQAVEIKENKERELLTIVHDNSDLESQNISLQNLLDEIEEKIKKSVTNREDAEEIIATNTALRDEKHVVFKERQEALNVTKMEVEKYVQKNEFHEDNLAKAESRLQELNEELDKIQKTNEGADEQAENMESTIVDFENRMKKIDVEIEELEKDVSEAKVKKEELMVQQKDFFDKREKLGNTINELDKETFRLNARKEKLEEQIEGKINYMWNEYEISYHNAKENVQPMEHSYTKIKSLVAETKTNIRLLGDVNVNAIEEYKETSERYNILKAQQEDLIKSEEALRKIIEDLDVEMRKQFSEKFVDIKTQFDKVFKELFGGGKGTLELVENEDILEAGIKINAQPPGKKLQNMMQLSGGEKALTAISLLFAIQNLKPSPFCLLDEIEAALDDSNVKRYAKYLQKLTKNTQFIVITHRHGTMASADALYGITMQEKGVSTLVSVKLIEEQLEE
nr:chromosome segregation protein SMC [Eubacterium sp.]